MDPEMPLSYSPCSKRIKRENDIDIHVSDTASDVKTSLSIDSVCPRCARGGAIKDNVFVCKHCKMIFNKFSCINCKQTFTMLSSLVSHLKMCYKDKHKNGDVPSGSQYRDTRSETHEKQTELSATSHTGSIDKSPILEKRLETGESVFGKLDDIQLKICVGKFKEFINKNMKSLQTETIPSEAEEHKIGKGKKTTVLEDQNLLAKKVDFADKKNGEKAGRSGDNENTTVVTEQKADYIEDSNGMETDSESDSESEISDASGFEEIGIDSDDCEDITSTNDISVHSNAVGKITRTDDRRTPVENFRSAAFNKSGEILTVEKKITQYDESKEGGQIKNKRGRQKKLKTGVLVLDRKDISKKGPTDDSINVVENLGSAVLDTSKAKGPVKKQLGRPRKPKTAVFEQDEKKIGNSVSKLKGQVKRKRGPPKKIQNDQVVYVLDSDEDSDTVDLEEPRRQGKKKTNKQQFPPDSEAKNWNNEKSEIFPTENNYAETAENEIREKYLNRYRSPEDTKLLKASDARPSSHAKLQNSCKNKTNDISQSQMNISGAESNEITSHGAKHDSSKEIERDRMKNEEIRDKDSVSQDSRKGADGKELCVDYICGVCKRTFKYMASLRKHLQSHSQSFHEGEGHLQNQQDNKEFFHPLVSSTSGSSEVTNATEGSVGNEANDEFVCGICKSRSNTIEDLAEHMQTHVRACSYEFVCNQCEIKCESLDKLRQHMLEHQKVSQEYVCNQCKIKCDSLDKLRQHMLEHKKVSQEFVCNQCKIKCDSLEKLRQHMLEHKKVSEEFVCGLCRATFTSASSLEGHIVTHDTLQANARLVSVKSEYTVHEGMKQKPTEVDIKPHLVSKTMSQLLKYRPQDTFFDKKLQENN